MRSLRHRLLLALVLGILALTVGGAVAVTGVVRAALETAFDDGLRARAREVAARLQLEIAPEHRHAMSRLGAALTGRLAEPGREAERAQARAAFISLADKALRVVPAYDQGPTVVSEDWFRAEDAAGTVILQSRSLGADDAPRLGSLDAQGTAISLPGGRPGRGLVLATDEITFATEGWTRAWQAAVDGAGDVTPVVRIAVARDASGLEASIASMRTGLLGGGALLALAAALLAWFAVGRVLAPLAAVGRRVETLDADALDARLPVAGVPVELVPVVTALNDALARLEHAFDRERALTGELAHELRTPIAELQTITDVARRWPEDAEIQARCVEQGHGIARHMGRVVNALLRVARAASGEARLEPTSRPVRAVIEAAWARLESTARERDQRLTNTAPDALAVHADAEVLDTILTNLLQNAAVHAPPGSTVETRAARDDQGVRLVIANPRGPDVEGPPEGLGLPLVETLTRALGIGFETATTDADFRATLRIPGRH